MQSHLVGLRNYAQVLYQFLKIYFHVTYLQMSVVIEVSTNKQTTSTQASLALVVYKNSSGDEIANVNFFYNIAHVEASDYAH